MQSWILRNGRVLTRDRRGPKGCPMELHCGSVKARFAPAEGGRLASLTVGGAEVLVSRPGLATEWGCYPMVPWAGRTRNGRFTWDERTFELPKNLAPHALHGTVFTKKWVTTGPDSMACALGDGWPWKGEVRSKVALMQDRLRWTLTVFAEKDAFPAVVGWHPWFRRVVEGQGEACLHFDPVSMLERDEHGIATMNRVTPTPRPWDDSFPDPSEPPRLSWPGGLVVTIESSCTNWVVYDEPAHAICIEPQSGPPDALNLGLYEVVEPGRPVTHHMEMSWSQR